MSKKNLKKKIIDQGGGGIKAPFHFFVQRLGDSDIIVGRGDLDLTKMANDFLLF